MSYPRQPTRADFAAALDAFLDAQPDPAHLVTVTLALDTAKPGWNPDGDSVDPNRFRIWLHERQKAINRWKKRRLTIAAPQLFQKE